MSASILTACALQPVGLGEDEGHGDFGNPCTEGRCPDLAAQLTDLSINGQAAMVEDRELGERSCAVLEGLAMGGGVRRLLRFNTRTLNVGNADLVLGSPAARPEFFEFAPCHQHWHFRGYAQYELWSGAEVVRRGPKLSFCLTDSIRPEGSRSTQIYDCSSQGIQAGWADEYGFRVEGNWIDVTGLAAGEYTLVVTINPDRTLRERSYANNTARRTVTIPDLPEGGVCPSYLPSARFACDNDGTLARCLSGTEERQLCAGRCLFATSPAGGDACDTAGLAACPAGISTAGYCDDGAAVWCGDGILYREYCRGRCVGSEGGALCE